MAGIRGLAYGVNRTLRPLRGRYDYLELDLGQHGRAHLASANELRIAHLRSAPHDLAHGYSANVLGDECRLNVLERLFAYDRFDLYHKRTPFVARCTSRRGR